MQSASQVHILSLVIFQLLLLEAKVDDEDEDSSEYDGAKKRSQDGADGVLLPDRLANACGDVNNVQRRAGELAEVARCVVDYKLAAVNALVIERGVSLIVVVHTAVIYTSIQCRVIELPTLAAIDALISGIRK